MSRRHRHHRSNPNHDVQSDRKDLKQDSAEIGKKVDREPVDCTDSLDHQDRGNPTDPDELVLDKLEKQMDKEYMMAGKAIAEVFRTLYITSLKLPDMKLHTDMMDVVNSHNRLSVVIHKDKHDDHDEDDHMENDHRDDLSDDEDYYSIGNYDEDEKDFDEEGWINDAD